MRTNVQFDHAQFITILQPYQEKDGGEIEYIPDDRLVNFASVHQPDLPRPTSATFRLYQNRAVMKVVGYAPACAGKVLRGAVSYEFSRKSRRRFMDQTHSWQIPDNYNRFHVVLTYPANYPDDWHVWKLHLKAFKRKLEAIFGEKIEGFWRLELQKRGAPHFHLILAMQSHIMTGRKLKTWVRQAWAKIAHTDDQYQGKYGTHVDKIYSESQLFAYVTKYCTKVSQLPQLGEVQGCAPYDDLFALEQIDQQSEEYRQKTIGRQWGKVNRPNTEPLMEFCLPEMQQDILRQVLSGFVEKWNKAYADKIRHKPTYVSYQVYGLKGYLLAYFWDKIFPLPELRPALYPFG